MRQGISHAWLQKTFPQPHTCRSAPVIPCDSFALPDSFRYKASIVYYFVFTVLTGMVVISLFIGAISLSMFKAFDDLQEEKALKVNAGYGST